MKRLLEIFRDDEDGAVTVDWVVLTAAIVVLATLVIANVLTASQGISGRIATALEEVDVGDGGATTSGGETPPEAEEPPAT